MPRSLSIDGRRPLIGIGAFNALSAVGGGIALLGGWLPIPGSVLDYSPFSDFFWPAMLLLVVIGGTQVWSIVAVWQRSRIAPLATIVAGYGMVIWVFVELAMMRGYSPLHGLYFVTGMLQLALVYALLGLWPIAHRPPA